jgi:hypothetical protein
VEEEVIWQLGWVMSVVLLGHLISNGDKKCATGQRCEFVAPAGETRPEAQELNADARASRNAVSWYALGCQSVCWFDPYPCLRCDCSIAVVYPDHAAHSMYTASLFMALS